MVNNILIFRTDRIGDLLITCPAVLAIKKYLKNSRITLITSIKNHDYAKSLDFFDYVTKFPENNFVEKIKFIMNLSKKKYDYVLVLDGKDRSLISSIFLRSKNKVGVISKSRINFFWKIFNIKFIEDDETTDLIKIYQDSLKCSNIHTDITNFDCLKHKKDNGFSQNISIKDFILIHLDEKWFNEFYIENYTNINPQYEEFINFLNEISKVNNILITTGINDLELINRLKNKFFEKISDKIFIKKNLNKLIYLIYKPSFDDIESLLRNSKILISCHGAITHASNSFNVIKVDILEKSKLSFYKRFSSYLNNYHPIFRTNFDILKKEIYQKVLKS